MDTPYSQAFFESHLDGALRSAQVIVPLVVDLVAPRSVVDVGCGTGTWLSVFRQHGVDDVIGIDGDYVERASLQIPEPSFIAADLAHPIALGRKFDLVVALEVAEHLPSASAADFVRSLTGLGPIVLFSAAVPGQGGSGHRNEQWIDYWIDLFAGEGYVLADALRPLIWRSADIEPWYAQNVVLFVSPEAAATNHRLAAAVAGTRYEQISMVHPAMFAEVCRRHEAACAEARKETAADTRRAPPLEAQLDTVEATMAVADQRSLALPAPAGPNAAPAVPARTGPVRRPHPAPAQLPQGRRLLKKILVVSAFPPEPAPEANHAFHICEQLAKSGVEVHVLCKRGSIAPATAEHRIVTHAVIVDWSWRDLPAIISCLRRVRPDVVLLLYIGWVYRHQPMITMLATMCGRLVPPVPCVVQFENIDDMPYPHSYLGRALRTAFRLWAGGNRLHYVLGTLMRDSARIIVLSSPHRARLLKHDPRVAEKTVILPPPPLIRFSQVSPATARAEMREAIGVSEGELVLMYWGFIYPGKGLETLIQAFQAVALRHAGVRLVVVGGMLDFPTAPISCVDYYRHARTLPETLGIADRVTWTGPFDWDSDVGSRYLYAGDIVVLPFDYGVTLNNSTLAAATTHGLPVIGTTLPIGHDEGLEHSRNIYLVPPKDAPALTDAIVRVITSPDLRETLRQGSVALAASSHRWDVMTERLTEVLESAIASRRAPSAAIAASAPAAGNALLEAAPRAPAQVWTEQNAADAPDAPLVSVVVAVYNVRKYLSQCLDSLVHQTLADIEIVVVNDASEDDSATIVEHYRSRYPVIRVVHCEQNVGLASVRNRGMAAARGRYVAFMDGDDWADVYMCEALYRRALEHRADVVIADTNVFYDDRKAFTAFFDQALRATFDPKVRTMPFQILSYPRVMLVEPVAWTKLYRRAFLHEHQLQFEEGMNSYEDMIFHFSTLLKAARVSFIDDRISFYRQNRPGQISGRTSRKVFEVFDVFDRIHENLEAWGVPEEIWAVLVKVELRQFNWLMKDRVRDEDKREFLGLASKQMNRIPQSGYWAFIRRADPDDVPILTALRRNWLSVYLRMLRLPPGMSGVVFAPLLWKQRPDAVKGAFGKGVASLRHRGTAPLRAFVGRVMAATTTELQRSAGAETLPQTAGVGRRGASGSRQPPVKAVTVAGQQLFFRDSLDGAGLDAAVSRVSADYYLARTAVFRTGDTVVDVGAHVGVFSLWLATLYPFITVYAVEPDPGNHAALRENIALNDLQNVVLIDKAVAADSRARTLYSDAIDSGKATLDRNLGFTYGLLQTAQVETTSVRELFRHHGIERCRLLKISAPGAVRDVLQGLAGARTIDLVCGEVDLAECRLGEVETISEEVARQHFWRTIQRHDGKTVHGWMHRLPEDLGE